MIDLIWVIRRARHFIEIFRHVTIIFIDHVVNVSIVKQTTFTFNNTNKFNLRLIRIFIYLFQFRLNIRYRFDKRHVISNVFFKLSIDRSFLNENENLNLKSYHDCLKDFFVNDQCMTYNDMLINMSNVFRQQLIDDYAKKKFWTKLIVMLINLTKRIDLKKFSQSLKVNFSRQLKSEAIRNRTSKVSESQSSTVIRRLFKKRKNILNTFNEIFDNETSKAFSSSSSKNILNTFDEAFDDRFRKKMYIDVAFELQNDFIYHLNERRRFCISTFCEQKIFRMTHDENQHFERYRCYQRISNFVYVSRLFKKFRLYIEHCLDCQLNQIKRHRLYEKNDIYF